MKTARRAFACATAVVAIAAAAEPPPDASRGCPGDALPRAMLQAINEARASARQCGARAMPAVPALRWDERLAHAATGHADDMARHDYFSHSSRDGRTVADRVSATGYAWRSVGENIAAGPDSVQAVMAGWLASPGHCANLMRPDFRDVAASCVQRGGNTYGRYWALVFGAS